MIEPHGSHETDPFEVDVSLPAPAWPTPWICIRCGKVNAPHSMQCSCEPDAAARERFGYVVNVTWPPGTEYKTSAG